MSQPFVGEIRLFGGNFAPQGWMFCDGSVLPISEYETLFQLIGTTYGGDGQSTFALPNLASRIPLHQGTTHTMGQTGGSETVTLTVNQLPAHTHPLAGSTAVAAATSPAGGMPAAMAEVTTFAYGNDQPLTSLAPEAMGVSGGNQPHENMPPHLAVTFIISLFGIFPSQT